jgi:hypothetical protein
MKFIAVVALSIICCTGVLAQQAPMKECVDAPVYGLLDFWVGEWEVYSGDQMAGENRIDKVLNGCAVLEHWTAAGGGQGMSLFYVDTDGVWQQVWVTEWSANPGGMKEKTLVEEMPDKGVRFQGEIKHPKIGVYLDRTTLTPLENGDVRQLIEISRDAGESWQTTFDAIYMPVTGK